MSIIHTFENRSILSWSIFLAGPTSRDLSVTPSWRPQAIKIFKKLGFEGDLIVPETRDGKYDSSRYDEQVDWELDNLDASTAIMFWIPRNMEVLPGMTTNVEFGSHYKSGKIVLGYPKDTPHIRYLNRLARKYDIPLAHTLEGTCKSAFDLCLLKLKRDLLPF